MHYLFELPQHVSATKNPKGVFITEGIKVGLFAQCPHPIGTCSHGAEVGAPHPGWAALTWCQHNLCGTHLPITGPQQGANPEPLSLGSGVHGQQCIRSVWAVTLGLCH